MLAQELLEQQDSTLFEVLDNPYPLSNNTPLALAVAAAMRKTHGKKLSGLQVYSRTDTAAQHYHNDVFIVLRHCGLWEVHHANYDNTRQPLSDQILGLSDGANPRFMSTILQLYLAKAAKGIRIVATASMLPTYLRVLNRVLKRSNDNYTVSSVDDNYRGVDNRIYSSVEIRPSVKTIAPSVVLV